MLISRSQIWLFFLVASLASILNLAALLIIPYEPDHSFILRYSTPRSALILFDFLVFIFLIMVTINLWMKTSIGEKIYDLIQNWLQDEFHVKVLHGIVLLGVAFGTFLLAELVFTDNRYLMGYLLRLSPIIGFLTIICAHLNYLFTITTKEPNLLKKFSLQIFFIAFIWLILNFTWFLGTITSLEETLIFKSYNQPFISERESSYWS